MSNMYLKKFSTSLIISSVQFSHSVMSNSLQACESQHTRPPCPSPTSGVYSNSCPLSRWCHPAISSSVVLFSSCPQSLPASESFPMSQLPELAQTHVHRVSDVIQPSHPLSSSSPPAPNPSQHQGLFQWVNSSHEVAKVLEFQFQLQSFQWTPRTDLL